MKYAYTKISLKTSSIAITFVSTKPWTNKKTTSETSLFLIHVHVNRSASQRFCLFFNGFFPIFFSYYLSFPSIARSCFRGRVRCSWCVFVVFVRCTWRRNKLCFFPEKRPSNAIINKVFRPCHGCSAINIIRKLHFVRFPMYYYFGAGLCYLGSALWKKIASEEKSFLIYVSEHFTY